MLLDKILEGYDYKLLAGKLNTEILGIENDSRAVTEGSLFIAEVGYTVDGHDYIQQAIGNGAVAVIIEKEVEIKGDVAIVKVQDTLDAMAYISVNFYNKPFENIHTIGITGTNGKTSTTYFIKSILEAGNLSTGIIGTMGTLIGDRKIETTNTTPNSLVMNKIMSEMVDAKIDYSIMEVSSHALALKRVEYMEFETGIFMNLSKDHLDYHETIQNYFESKARLFSITKKANIINYDDKYGRKIIEKHNDDKLISFGLTKEADVFASNISYELDKVKYTLNIFDKSIDIVLNIPGEFSIYNSMAAAACAYSYGIDMEIIKLGLESIKGVRGRFEVIPTNTDYTVIIDFAHTADGLKQALHTMEDFVKGRKIVVFGAGGNRDKTKRPEMGEVVGKMGDIAIVTSDNPRFEEPEAIVDDVIVGVKKGKAEVIKIVDRKEAIEYALDIARKGDIILLAGKGHETYTLINGVKLPFDEKEIVLNYLEK